VNAGFFRIPGGVLFHFVLCFFYFIFLLLFFLWSRRRHEFTYIPATKRVGLGVPGIASVFPTSERVIWNTDQ
jgi:membrane-associated protease RseP (regulator of RpoE activity)